MQSEGRAPFREWQTWYRVAGRLDGAHPPLVVLHGGPGCTHDYLDALLDLAGPDRAVVHYDQLGNGFSTHLRHMRGAPGEGFWTPALFLEQLEALLAHLGITTNYDLLGQSWGGMLAAEHAVRPQSRGLRRLVIANSPAAMPTWIAEADRLRLDLPPATQATLLRHEADGTTDSADYAEATQVFYDRHLCRIPWPVELRRTFDAMADDPTVYHTMNGPNEFHVIGTLRDWSIVERLGEVNVPTLLISGRHDEATEACVRPYAERIPGARWTIFEQSSHLPHIEERAAFMHTVRGFLDADIS
jgi:L-proline amide hydrolase